MPTIIPQGIVHLLKGIPLTESYEHTIYFETPAEQERYFLKHVFRSFDKVSYVGEMGDAVIKLEVPADDIREASYIMFKNIGFTDKWFYGFINGVQRISNNVSAVSYKIDVMQTWYLFDTELRPCMVEREHAENDGIGLNIIPENLEVGEYYLTRYGTDNLIPTELCYIFAVTQAPNFDNNTWENVSGNIYGGVFSGVKLIAATNAQIASNLINFYNQNGRGDAILTITAMPKWCVKFKQQYGIYYEVEDSLYPESLTISLKMDSPMNQPDWHIRNNKLFTYPYSYLLITNYEGQELILRWECFNNIKNQTSDSVMLKVYGSVSCDPQLILMPSGYKRPSGHLNCLEYITTGIFPQVAFTSDNYRSWLAQTSATRATQMSLAQANAGLQSANMQNVNQLAKNEVELQYTRNIQKYMDVASDALGLLGGSGSLNGMIDKTLDAVLTNSLNLSTVQAQSRIERNNAAFSVYSAQNAIQALNAQVADHSVIPPSAKGNATADLLTMLNLKTFDAYIVCPYPDYAMRIDMYFQMYGYQVNIVKIPNTHVRDLWTYTKTSNCNVKPKEGRGCSAADLNNINVIFNHGITFWRGERGMENFMQYNQDNIITEGW